MQRELRLTGSKRFLEARREGRGWANRLLVLKVIPNDLDRSRFGLTLSKRVGSAVVRNKVKRRLREILRLTPVNAGWDIVLIARKAASSADYVQIKLATEDLLRRAKLLACATSPQITSATNTEVLRRQFEDSTRVKASRGLVSPYGARETGE